MKSLFLPKYEQKIVKISALTTQGSISLVHLQIFDSLLAYLSRNQFCMFALSIQPINQLKPVQQLGQELMAYCPNVYIVA